MRTYLIAFPVLAVCLPGISPGKAAELVRAQVQSGAVALTPQNTSIEFVCAHAGAKPDPRKGGFSRFNGKAELESGGQSLKALTLEIDATSLWTEFDKLTTHLKSPDFFDVRRHPTAKFESTKIDIGSSPSQTSPTQITGKLTLHGVTKEVTIPATIKLADGSLALHSQFTIDRSEFGMNFDPQKVENKVALTVSIGKHP